MYCPHCGSPDVKGKFCETCGKPLAEAVPEVARVGTGEVAAPNRWGDARTPSAEAASGWGAPQTGRTVTGPCPSCGTQIDLPHMVFCPACGLARGQASVVAAPESRGPKVCRGCHRVGPGHLTTCLHCGLPLSGSFGAGATPMLIVGGVLIVGVAMVAILAAILVPNFIRARAQGQFTSCESNEKNIGTALEMYSTDNQGNYPRDLRQVAPNYLRVIPTCPSAGTDTYTATYVVGRNPDAYTLYCRGANHTALSVPSDHPQYNSNQGLVSGH